MRVDDARKQSPERDEAQAFLSEVLADGLRPMRDVESEARDAGISPATLQKAARHMGVRKERVRDPETGKTLHWSWELP